MKLRLKKEVEDCYVYIPFTKSNVMGKFIEEGLYKYLYKISPDLFEVELNEAEKRELKASKERLKDIIDVILEIEDLKDADENKEIKKDDIFIDSNTNEGDITE